MTRRYTPPTIHRVRLVARKSTDPYRATYFGKAICKCGWESEEYESRYSSDAALIACRAAKAFHTAHPTQENHR